MWSVRFLNAVAAQCITATVGGYGIRAYGMLPLVTLRGDGGLAQRGMQALIVRGPGYDHHASLRTVLTVNSLMDGATSSRHAGRQRAIDPSYMLLKRSHC